MKRLLPILALAASLHACGNQERTDHVAALTAARPRPDFGALDTTQVIRKPSGLQITVLRPGPGPKPSEGSRLRIHYKGAVQGGAVFDDTWQRQEPFDLVLGQTKLIPGMEEALRSLRVGSRAKLVIPPALAYPKDETPPNIPPGSTLIYEIDILGNI